MRYIQVFITYDGNGSTSGTVPPSVVSYMPGMIANVYSGNVDLRKSGHLFGGWNMQPDGDGDSYLPGGSRSYYVQ